jgi:hypothetical protein
MWDAEKSLARYGNDGRPHAWYTPLLTETNTRGGRSVPSRIWKAMIANQGFRELFGQVVKRNLYNNGPLTNQNAGARWRAINDFLGYSNRDQAAIIGESARWGDTNINGPSNPIGYDDWYSAVDDARDALTRNVEKFIDEFSDFSDVLN